MTMQQKKSKKFGAAVDSYERYVAWMIRLVNEGKLDADEAGERCRRRAEMLGL